MSGLSGYLQGQMIEDIPPERPSRASRETQSFVVRREEARRAAAADRERARAEGRLDADPESPNRAAFLIGLVVVLALCAGGWFVIDQMRCNPLFSDAGFAQSRSCR